MTTTTAPNAQAWLAKEATPLGPFVVRLDADRIGSAAAPGHRVVVVDPNDALKRVERILRIGSELESTTTVCNLDPPTPVDDANVTAAQWKRIGSEVARQ